VFISRTAITGLIWRLRPSVWRAAWWTLTSFRRVRHQLEAGVAHPVVRRPPSLPAEAGLGVDAVLQRTRASCLEGAMVRQQWLASHGIVRDVIIGLPAADFGDTPAHAWVDGFEIAASGKHIEIHRIAAPAGRGPLS